MRKVGGQDVVSIVVDGPFGRHWLFIGQKRGSTAIWATLLSQAGFTPDEDRGFDLLAARHEVRADIQAQRTYDGISGFNIPYGNSMTMVIWGEGDVKPYNRVLANVTRSPRLTLNIYSEGRTAKLKINTQNLAYYFRKAFPKACANPSS
ncbi:MAG: hypothetical protein VYA08_11940 [Pseudomonadota bacterium]|nr:hypothetical protein [Pseudomonadota bacterium]